MARLGDVCIINPKGEPLPDHLPVSFIPMQKVSECGDIDTSEIRTYKDVKKGFTLFQNGDVLFAKITPCMENGKGAIADSLMNGKGAGSTEFHVLRPDYSKITSEWLYFLTSWEQFRKDCEKHMTGSGGQKRVPKSFLENYEVKIPTIEVQKNIVNSIAKLSALISLRKQQLAKLDELVKARFVEMFGVSRTNPKDWKIVNLETVADVGSSKRVFVEELQEEGIPFYRGTEVGALAEGKEIKPELFVTPEHYQVLCKATGAPAEGDLLMPSICPDGRIWLVENDEPFYFKDGRVLWVHPISAKIDSCYLQYALKEKIMDDYDSIASGTTFAELKIFALKSLPVMLPALDLQLQFSAFIHTVKRKQLTIQLSRDKLEVLKKSLMQDYFG